MYDTEDDIEDDDDETSYSSFLEPEGLASAEAELSLLSDLQLLLSLQQDKWSHEI